MAWSEECGDERSGHRATLDFGVRRGDPGGVKNVEAAALVLPIEPARFESA